MLLTMHSKKLEPKLKLREFSFEAIGTHWHIEYEAVIDASVIEQVVRDRIELFDKAYSRFRDDSVITRMSKRAGVYELPVDAAKLFDFYELLYKVTSGAVSPAIGNTLSDAGYDAEYSLGFKKKTIAPGLADTYSRKKNIMTMNSAVTLDIGAAGKGYLVDIVCALMKNHGVTNTVVNAGGDVAVYLETGSVQQIALQHPRDSSQAIGVAVLHTGSLCGSSIHLRNWGTHHHIIDPRTAESPLHTQAVWVYAESTMLADGLSTALFFTPAEKLRQSFDFEYAIIKADDSLVYSPKFPATFF